MRYEGILACYYPTTVMFVDDDKDFLTNFSVHLEPSLAYKLYTSPTTALRLLHQQRISQVSKKCFSHYAEAINKPVTSHTVNLDLGALHREVYDEMRFSEISVVITDYNMPTINGIDFCARLKNSPVKKILLTGQADAQIAIDAFNEGIIDHFILKNDPNNIEKINNVIHGLQLDYFYKKTELITNVLAVGAPSFFQDPVLAKLFYRLQKEHDIVEYYLTDLVGTFLLLTASGEASWLLIRTQQDLNMYKELARDNDVPFEVIHLLDSNTVIPHFWQVDRYYDIDPIEWSSRLYPAQICEGQAPYYYALVANPSISNLDAEGVRSYNAYLEAFDNELIEQHAEGTEIK